MIPSLAAQSVSAENASSPWSSTTTYVTVVPSATSFAFIAASLVTGEKSRYPVHAVLSACSPARPGSGGRMAHTDIPSSDLRGTSPAELESLERDLAAAVDGEVRFDAGTRGAYSTDGSNFRQVPIGVVLPRTVEAGAAAVAVCARMASRCCPGAAAPAWPASAPTRRWSSTGRSTATVSSKSTRSSGRAWWNPGSFWMCLMTS